MHDESLHSDSTALAASRDDAGPIDAAAEREFASRRVVAPFRAAFADDAAAPNRARPARVHVSSVEPREPDRACADVDARAPRRARARDTDASVRLAGARADLAGWRELVAERGLAAISHWSTTRLEREARLSRALAQRFAAAFALGRAVERARPPPRASIRDARSVRDAVFADVRGAEREVFFALLLDGRHRLQRRVVVAVGTLTCSLVHPREVFARAVRESAAAVVVAHNHPSGDPTPSAEDVEVTRRLVEAGRLLGIPLLDHVVVAAEGCTSLRELHPELGFAPGSRA